MLKIDCRRCGAELDEPGGILLGPPDDAIGDVRKTHVCEPCYAEVFAFILAGK